MKLVVCVFFFALARAEDLISISLVRHKSGLETMLEQNTHPKHLKKIFGQDGYLEKPTPKPPANDTIQLFKALQSQYYGEVLIGSPGQKFKVLFDTSSVTTWVPSILCSPFAYPPCAFRNKYDSTKSSTYIPVGINRTLITDKGKLYGFISKEKMHVGHVNVMNQSFVEIEEMSLIQMLYINYDGIIGLGLDDNPNDTYIPFFYNLVQQNKLFKKIFSFYINRDETTSKGGSLFFGGSNKKHYNGSFTYLPVTNKYFWQFKMDKVFVNYKLPHNNRTLEVCSRGCNAFPSSGDVLISGPATDIKIINRILSAHYVPHLDRFEISCSKINKLPAVTFVLAGKEFTIYGRDYVQKLSYGPAVICLSAFTRLRDGSPDLWGLGVSFLGRYYAEFNMEKQTIGFANAVGA